MRHYILILFILFISVALACTKISSEADVFLTDPSNVLTKASKEANPEDYLVTKEMVVEYLRCREGKEHEFDITSYPSDNDALLYVVNYPEGWKILPGDSRFGLVLAQGSKGSIDLSSPPENPGFRLWLEDNLTIIQNARGREYKGADTEQSVRIWQMIRSIYNSNSLDGHTSNKTGLKSGDQWAKINYHGTITYDTLAYKAPLIQTKWGQGHPWYVSMPIMYGDTCLTGCPAVAVSQVLYYFHCQQNVPSGLYDNLFISGLLAACTNFDHCVIFDLHRYNFTYNSSKWNNMPLDSISGNTTGYKNVSDLMLDVGARLGQHYSPWDSHVDVNPNYPYYDTTPCKLSGTWAQYSVSSTFSSVKSSLVSNKPVIVSANGNSGGHTWIIDGYLDIEETHTNNYEWWPVSMIPSGTAVFGYMDFSDLLLQYGTVYPGMPAIEQELYPLEFFSMNWGWDGQYDGEYKPINPTDYAWLGFGTHVAVQYNLSPSEFTVN